MAKNRKHQSAAIRFGPVLKALFLCLIFGGSGIGYVWQKNQVYELGLQIRAREHRLTALENQNKKLRDQLAILYSPPYLDAQIKRLNLGLVPPQPSQIWRLPEPVPDAPPAGRAQQYAAQRDSTWN